MSILIVDDEQRVALSIERTLRQDYLVRVALNGAEALKIAHREKPDLVILDVSMPGMSGLEVCRELRRDPSLKHVPILMLTARGRVEDKVEGFEAGADDYLTKPFDIRELQLRVSALLLRTGVQHQQTASAETLTVGQLTLNRNNYQLSAGEKTVLLTPVEFRLIHHLMSHPGEIMSAERLLREVWDFPSDIGTSDLVRMHLRNLRLKIEPDIQNPRFILTVPRHGYTVATS